MTKFLFWTGNVLIALSIVLTFIHPVLSACSAFIGLVLTVISSIKSDYEHRRQIGQLEYNVKVNSPQGQLAMVFDRMKPYGNEQRRSSAWRSKV